MGVGAHTGIQTKGKKVKKGGSEKNGKREKSVLGAVVKPQ